MTQHATLVVFRFRTLLAVASFAIYAAAVLFLRQNETNHWPIEASVAIPSAVSFVVYGTPLGTQAESIAVTFGDVYRPDKK